MNNTTYNSWMLGSKAKTLSSLVGGIGVFLLATSCCWLPALAAALFGSAVGATVFSAQVEPFSGILMALGSALVAWAGWQIYKQRKSKRDAPMVVLQTLITCPHCGFQKQETMPENACTYFYECEGCKVILKPLSGDCCVFCSYATVKCPPIQIGASCC